MSDDSSPLYELNRDDKDDEDDDPSPPGISPRHPEATPGNVASLTPA